MAAHGSQFKSPTLRRYEKAKARRQQWDGLLEDTYRLALPNHDAVGTATAGEKKDHNLYDSTAVRSLKWKRARLHGELFPPFKHWTTFHPADMDLDEFQDSDRQEWTKFRDRAVKKFHKAIDRSNFHLEVPLAIGDAMVSTGALLIHKGTPKEPLRFEAVPVWQVIPEESVDGVIRTVFRDFPVMGRDILVRWPDAKIPDKFQSQIDKEPEKEIKIVEATIHLLEHDAYAYEVFIVEGDEARIVNRRYKSSPWVVFRVDKGTGETMGRGPAIDVRADTATANRTKELVLMNASISTTGIWQADDDGVLNPAAIELTPGTIIPKAVGSAGLTPLEAPGRFDVSQIVLKDLQQNIESGIKGPSLPPVDAGARTAYELGERRADEMAVELPMSLRLLTELDYPLVMRCLYILSLPEMAGSKYYIGEFKAGEEVIRPVPTSPLVRLQEIADAQEANQALLMSYQIDPNATRALVDMSSYLRDFLISNGFQEKFLMTEDKAAEQEARIRLAMAKIQAEERLKAMAEQEQAQARPRPVPVGTVDPWG